MAQDFVILFALKDGAAKQQVVEDDAGRKYVTNGLAFGGHVSDVDDFGSHKAGSAAADEEVVFFFGVGGQSEVADGHFAGVLALEEDILGFEIAVDDLVFGEMAESSEDALNDAFDLVLGYMFIILDKRSFTLRTWLSCCPSKYYRMT